MLWTGDFTRVVFLDESPLTLLHSSISKPFKSFGRARGNGGGRDFGGGRGNSSKKVKRLQKGAGSERGEMGLGGGRSNSIRLKRLQPHNWFFKTPRVAHGRLGREVGGAGERGLLPPHPPTSYGLSRREKCCLLSVPSDHPTL